MRAVAEGRPRVLGIWGASVEREHLFRGSALNAIDAKGRLSVPAFIRQKIERRSDEKILVLSPHSDFQCLVGYDANYSAVMQDKAEKRLGENPDPLAELEMQASLFAGTVDTTYDASGRIILPPRLKKRASIDELAMFIGMGGEFQIWNPQLALKCEAAAIRAVAADLLEERGAA
jgi:MraZ protein